MLVDVEDHTSELNSGGAPDISGVTAIGVDWRGELIVVSQQGNLFRIVPDDGTDGCAVIGDVNGDGVVDVDDVLQLINAWGACGLGQPCPADLDGDGVVGVNDMLIVLANWTI